jgi:hypothetical protein
VNNSNPSNLVLIIFASAVLTGCETTHSIRHPSYAWSTNVQQLGPVRADSGWLLTSLHDPPSELTCRLALLAAASKDYRVRTNDLALKDIELKYGSDSQGVIIDWSATAIAGRVSGTNQPVVDREKTLEERLADIDREFKEGEERRKKESDERDRQWAAERAAQEKARNDYASRSDIPPRIASAVRDQKVVLGMTENEVQISWGPPRSKTQSVNGAGEYSTWFYSNRDTTINFINSKVDSWTTTATQ